MLWYKFSFCFIITFLLYVWVSDSWNVILPVQITIFLSMKQSNQGDMAITHFLNYKNSCAVDSFLDLSFYCYGDLLTKRAVSDKCPILSKTSEAYSKWKQRTVSLSAIRQPVWDYLSSTVQSFAIQGSLNPAISDIFSLIGSSEDEDFCLRISRLGLCNDCGNPLQIPLISHCPLLLSPEVLKKANNHVQSAIDNVVSTACNITKPHYCHVCEKNCLVTDCAIRVKCPYVCIVEVPVVLPGKSTPTNMSENEVIDLTVDSSEFQAQGHSSHQYTPPVVLEDVVMNYEINIASLGYEMCGAIQGNGRHFSIATLYDGKFVKVDDLSLRTPLEKAFSSYPNKDCYITKQSDGYFIFVYRVAGSLTYNNTYTMPNVTITVEADSENQIEQTDSHKTKGYSIDQNTSPDKLGDKTQEDLVFVQKVRVKKTTDVASKSNGYENDIGTDSQPTLTPKQTKNIQLTMNMNRAKEESVQEQTELGKPDKTKGWNIGQNTPDILDYRTQNDPVLAQTIELHNTSSARSKSNHHECEMDKQIKTTPKCIQHKINMSQADKENVHPETIKARNLESSYLLLHSRPFFHVSFISSFFAHPRTVMLRLENLMCRIFENIKTEFIFSALEKKTHISARGMVYLLCHVNQAANCQRRHGAWGEVGKIISMVVTGDVLKGTKVYMTLEKSLSQYIHVQGQTRTFVQIKLLEAVCSIPSCKVKSIVCEFLEKVSLDTKTHACCHDKIPCVSLEAAIVFLCSRRKYSDECKELVWAITTAFEQVLPNLKSDRPPLGDIQNKATDETQQQKPRSRNTNHVEHTTLGTPKNPRKLSTLNLLKSNKGYNRRASDRVKQQRFLRRKLTEDVHCGGKQSFKASLSYELAHMRSTSQSNGWDGSITSDDLIDILESTPTKSGKTLLDEAAQQRAKRLNAESVIKMVDSYSGYALINKLRMSFPDQLPSMYAIKKAKRYLYQEYQAVLQPSFIPYGSFTKCGIKIDPFKLMKCLRQLYYYITDNEFWRLWGDGREIGKRMSTIISLSCINNEQHLHGVKYHSPKDIWPLCIFYGDDHRWNLEANLGSSGGRPGWLNEWVEQEQTQTQNSNGRAQAVTFFLSGDAPFIDAMEGGPGELGATTKKGFNVYMTCDKTSIGDVHPETGFRSGIKKVINRVLPNSLLPSIPLNRVVFCIDHATTRIVEKLIKNKLQTIALMSTRKTHAGGETDSKKALDKFKENLIMRGIRKADRLVINGDGSVKEGLTLNKTEAHVILHDTNSFLKKYPSILEGVTGTNPIFKIDDQCRNALGWESSIVSELELEGEIWKQLSNAIFLLRRSDPIPTPKNNAISNSQKQDDYIWGLTKSQIDSVCRSLDLFHKLYLIRYGLSEITPYMAKLVDVTPLLLNEMPLPFMRFSTEGGEHSHYSQACYYFQHTQRGGAHKTTEPIQSVLFWHYRQLRSRILAYQESSNKAEQEIGLKFSQWIRQEWAATIFSKVWKGRKTRRAIRFSKESGNCHIGTIFHNAQATESEPRNVIMVGQLPSSIRKLGSRDQIKEILKEKSLHLLNSDASSLPKNQVPIGIIVVTQQSQCDIAKPPKVLIQAMHRKWPVVGFDYIHAVIENSGMRLPCSDKFLLNVEALSGHPDILTSTLSLQRRNFERPCDLHPITQAKNNQKQKHPKREPKDEHPNQFHLCKSPYSAFFVKNFRDIPKEAKSMKEKHNFMKRKWIDMSHDEKKVWHEVIKK